jgi:hypothetical protein
MRDPKLELARVYTTARTYYLRSPEELGGWAMCTVNDATGELSIISDWGNWSHMWNPRHIGRGTLHHFLADRDSYDYLAGKLLGRKDCWELDPDGTVKKWRTQLAERRRTHGQRWARLPNCLRDRGYFDPVGDQPYLDKETAREIWDRLGDLVDVGDHEAIFIERALQIDGFQHWVCERPWDTTVHEVSSDYTILTKVILPALATACAATVAERSEVACDAAGITAS